MNRLRVVCFYTDLFPATKATLPPATEMAWCDRADDLDYWHQLTARWDGRADLVVIEQDMELHDQVIPQFRECRSDWCTFPYLPHAFGNPREDIAGYAERLAAAGALTASLGCARFSAGLQRRFPLADVRWVDHKYNPAPAAEPGYMLCDAWISSTLAGAGLRPCVHEPPVVNHHWEWWGHGLAPCPGDPP